MILSCSFFFYSSFCVKAIPYLLYTANGVVLLQGSCTVKHQTESRRSAGERQEERGQGGGEQDPILRQLQERCFNELKHLVLETSRQVSSGVRIHRVSTDRAAHGT